MLSESETKELRKQARVLEGALDSMKNFIDKALNNEDSESMMDIDLDGDFDYDLLVEMLEDYFGEIYDSYAESEDGEEIIGLDGNAEKGIVYMNLSFNREFGRKYCEEVGDFERENCIEDGNTDEEPSGFIAHLDVSFALVNGKIARNPTFSLELVA